MNLEHNSRASNLCGHLKTLSRDAVSRQRTYFAAKKGVTIESFDQPSR